jgi:hypothetical protein
MGEAFLIAFATGAGDLADDSGVAWMAERISSG